MKKYYTLMIAALLTACGPEKASFETQEQARRSAIENAEFNAKVFRDANAPQLKVRMRGDSSISPTCITGDGWASVDLIRDGSLAAVVELKCSTVSDTIGCMTKNDFQQRADYAKQDGTCNRELPFPLPKIVK